MILVYYSLKEYKLFVIQKIFLFIRFIYIVIDFLCIGINDFYLFIYEREREREINYIVLVQVVVYKRI